MDLKIGTNVTLKVAPGVYFPEQVGVALAYQIVNNRTEVVEFEEVQLAAAWEAFSHFDKVIGDIYDEMEGRAKPSLLVVGADALPDEPKPH